MKSEIIYFRIFKHIKKQKKNIKKKNIKKK